MHNPNAARYAELRRSGDINGATGVLKRVLSEDPRADWGYNELIELLFAGGKRVESEARARVALRVNPRNARAHDLFGSILSELNDLPAGEWHFRRALELGGETAPVLANLALNLMQQGRTDEAESAFAKADGLAPDELRTLAHWSKLAEVSGDLPRAKALLERAAAAHSARDVDLLRANLLARTGQPADALALIDAAPAMNGDAMLERGRLLDRLARFDEAWTQLVAGKAQLARESGGLTYPTGAVEAFFARMKKFFVLDNIRLLPRAAHRPDLPQPLFIVGFPRSGTTLIEQVLTSHSAIRAGGELSFITELRKLSLQQFPSNEPYPESLHEILTADHRYAATLFRDYYFARAEGYGLTGGGRAFFTDKMPFNEIWLPVIRMAFPTAPIVRILRHPLDVCVSMLANNMTHGFNCGYAVKDIVHHLIAVSSLDEHYARETRGAGVWPDEFVLRYEDFVADQRGQTEKLLRFLGLTFEDACLDFHSNRRYAPTPSYAQVTQKLNDKSIGRHRHYAAQLTPFLGQLEPLLRARGY
jgi:tetratricopeptide (TPR) repeat protein